jgi:hypothetical protein
MIWPIVDQVAPLAQALEVGWRAVRRVVVKMRCRQNDTCHAQTVEGGAPWRNASVSVAVTPAGFVAIEPPAIRQA